MANNSPIWQQIGRHLTAFFRRLSQCFTTCFNPSTSEDDQLLQHGPSQSPSVDNNFIDRVRSLFTLLLPKEKLLAKINDISFQYEEQSGPIFHPSPNVSRHLNQLSEEEQIRIAQRLGLIQHLPLGSFDGQKKNKE